VADEHAASTGDQPPAIPPGDATSPEPPPALNLEFAAISIGSNGSQVLAHDRRRLESILIHATPAVRTARASTSSGDLAAAVRTVETNAMQRLRTARRVARGRRAAFYLVALGLPFLTAALLGLVGIWIARVPVIGDALGTFVGAAGSSAGGLPLAVVISTLPSVWLVRRARRPAMTATAPARADDAGEQPEVRVTEDLGSFATEAEELLRDLAGILGGNPRATAERARRLVERFDALGRIAARHGVPSVAAFAGDAAARFREATRPARRLVPGLRGRQPSVAIADVLAPYQPTSQRKQGPPAPLALGIGSGVVLAALAFFAAGVFRLGSDEALLLRPNEAVVFPSSGTVFNLGRGFDGPSGTSKYTVSLIGPSGIFWAWPRPITDRTLLHLEDRATDVTAAFPTGGAREDVQVTFRYDVSDVKSFATGVGLTDEPDERVAALLEPPLETFLRGAREALAAQLDGASPASVTGELRVRIGALLTQFATEVNATAQIGALGITVQPGPEFRFVR
jgi:hypothetical protein